MTCSCGDVMNVEAASRDEAVGKLKDMMTEDAVKAHYAEKHPGQDVPPMDQVSAMIETGVQQAA